MLYFDYVSYIIISKEVYFMKKKIMLFAVLFAMIITITAVQVQAATTYNVKSGDTLWNISQKVGVPVKVIVNNNSINNPSNIYVGQKLIITITVNGGQSSQPYGYTNYTVKSGDTLWTIANKFNTTIEKVVDLNNIDYPYYVYIGQVLKVPGTNNGNTNPVNSKYAYYTVQPGDILWNIAQKYGTTVKKLVEVNNIKDSYDLYVGRRLLIPIKNNSGNNNNNGSNNTGSYVPYSFYEVKSGDQIWTIADYFGVKVSTLVNYNNIDNINEIQAVDVLIIPLKNSSKLSYLKTASSKLNNYYRVNNNETVQYIAEFFNIPEEGIRAINQMRNNEEVYTGQRLLMPVSPALFKKHQLYKVQAGGEYIFDIAFNKGVSINSILKANYLKNKNTKFNAGTIIAIPLDKNSQATWIEYENGKPLNSWLG